MTAMSSIQRRRSVTVDVGGVAVGGEHPIVVQSMTNTDTADADATAIQVAQLAHAGSELVRVTVNNEAAAQAVPVIRQKLDRLGVGVPIIGDFHYNGHLLLTRYPECAARARQVPNQPRQRRHASGTTSSSARSSRSPSSNGKPVRIGVNWGSLDQQLLTEMMDANARLPEPRDAPRRDDRGDGRVRAALRASWPRRPASATTGSSSRPRSRACRTWSTSTRALAARCDYPLHLGLTEAGMGSKGIVATTAGLSILLQRGDRRHDPRLAHAAARAATAPRRSRSPSRCCSRSACAASRRRSRACPGCGRTTSTFFQEMARGDPSTCATQMPVWREAHPGVEEMRVAVMGCVVNGPGESKHADIGISLPGTFEEPVAPVFVDGELRTTLRGDDIVPRFLALLDEYVVERYPSPLTAAAPS